MAGIKTSPVGSSTDTTLSSLQSAALVNIDGLDATSAGVVYNLSNTEYRFYSTYDGTSDTFTYASLRATGLKLAENSANGNESISWQAPASLTTSYTLTLPADVPAANQALFVVDAEGNTEWRAVASLAPDISGGSNEFALFNNIGEIDSVGPLTDGQIFIGRTGQTPLATAPTGTNISIVGGTGTLSFSIPQSVATTATPTFNSMTLTSALTVNGAVTLGFAVANRALVTNGASQVVSSAVTDTEVGYLSGVTSGIQSQINSKADDADLTAHINDVTDAHDASAISNTPAGNLAATDVQGALNELQGDIDTLDTNKLDVAGGTITGNLTVSGDLQVDGTSTTINTATLDVEDANITVNKNGNDASAEGAGLTIERAGTDGALVYEDALASKFKIGPAGSEVEVATVSGAQTLTNKSIDASQIDSGTLPDARIQASGVTQHEGSINHDALLNFVGNEHIDHSSVSISAGTGLSGGGDLTTTRILSVDEPNVNHDNLQNYVANEHVDHSTVTLTAGTGLTGGGDITASRTFNLADTAVTPGSYGDGATVPTLTVDQQGRITAASETDLDLSGQSVGELSDIDLTGLANGNVLTYNSVSGNFEPSSAGSGTINDLNGQTGSTQTFAVGSTGSDFNISSSSNTHTFNLPDAGPTTRGVVGTGTQTFAGAKTFSSALTLSDDLTVGSTTLFADVSTGNVGIGTSSPSEKLEVLSSTNLAAKITSTGGFAGLRIDAATGNDPFLNFRINNVTKWLFGVDASVSDDFVFALTAFGTNNFGSISTAGAWTLGPSGGLSSSYHQVNGSVVAARAGSVSANGGYFGHGAAALLTANMYGDSAGAKALVTKTGATQFQVLSDSNSTAKAFDFLSNYQDAQTADAALVTTNQNSIGSVTQAGAWTLGPSSGGNAHTFNNGVGPSTRIVNFNNTNASASQSVIAFQRGGTEDGFIGADGTNAFKVLDSAGTSTLMSVTDAGAVTLGPASSTVNHTVWGNLNVGGTNTVGTASLGAYVGGDGILKATRDGGIPGGFNRLTSDGTLILLSQDSVAEGSISVSGTTVSYNGAHLSRWSQFNDKSTPEVLRGTVMSSTGQMAAWDGEDNEQLTCSKVSDQIEDSAVSGVFDMYDLDDEENTSDFFVAQTGDFVIRIAQDVTVQVGDLLESAGDGTAKPQADNIVRASTIAKVMSTEASVTYDDGSYCVPCLLMIC